MNPFEIIEQAIRTGNSTVWIKYRDFHGNITERNVIPLEWLDPGRKFSAYCHLRKENREFCTPNILNCELVSPNGTTASKSPIIEKNTFQNEVPHVEIQPTSVVKKRQSKNKVNNTFGSLVTEITTAEAWSRFGNYLKKCLIQENYQQYVITIDGSNQIFFRAEPREIYQVLQTNAVLTFQRLALTQQNSIYHFIKGGTQRKNQQLCLGYPLFALNGREVAPLIFSSLVIEETESEIRLRAEDYQVSYAALKSLDLSGEEIEPVLSECAQLEPQAGYSIIETVQSFLIGKLSEILGQTLTLRSWDSQKSPAFYSRELYSIPVLFWVSSSIATSSLITELSYLSEPSRWGSVPAALRDLLNYSPTWDYPDAVPIQEDLNIYMTSINDQQRRAIGAMEAGKVSVITGPPGTGKSQMVLNMIAQAVLHNQSVLFASRNNKAVDVVMSRLCDELKFPGAVRTGNRDYRLKAAEQIASTMDLITRAQISTPLAELQKQYLVLRDQIFVAEKTLRRVRELGGLIESHRVERDNLTRLIHPKLLEVAETHAPNYDPLEAKYLQTIISALIATNLRIKDRQAQLELQSIHILKESDPEFFQILAHYEDQWGSFGGGLLHPAPFKTLEELQTYLQIWLTLLPASGIQSEITQLNQSFRELSELGLRSYEALPVNLQEAVQTVSTSFNLEKLYAFIEEAKTILKQARSVQQGRISWLEKVLIWVGFINPSKQIKQQLIELYASLGLSEGEGQTSLTADIALLTLEVSKTVQFLELCLLQRRIKENRKAFEEKTLRFQEAIASLPEAIREDLCRLEIPAVNLVALRSNLETTLKNLTAFLEERNQLVARINAKIEANTDALKMLSDFKETTAGKDKRLWNLRTPASLTVIEKHLIKWRHLFSLWEVNTQLQSLEREVNGLPAEKEAISTLTVLAQQQLEIGARILRVRWLERVKTLDNSTLRTMHTYAASVRQFLESQKGNSAPESAFSLTDQFDLKSALKIFPVWATTNLAVKATLPLTPELFDLVIIDEASQSDIPSALPLLYRAKKIVVIGDRKQLKHVATLSHDVNQEAADEFGIDSAHFSYNSHSLFDIAFRSVGIHPGTLTLKEHYRSYPQIIQFSNEEFYDNELTIKTDLERRDIPKSYLDIGGGIFWLHAEGQAQRPASGSAFNSVEVNLVQDLVSRLIKSLRQHKMQDATIGVVTPFREQVRRFGNLAAVNKQVVVGTAHEFQGNERDIMIFSPVLAPGLPEGSLKWLDSTNNLLNVAITRARSTLIIVGHWDYCRNLSPSSKYRRLTDYLSAVQPNQPARQIDELPLFGGVPFDVIGMLLNPRNTEYNRTTLRRLVTSCRDFVWWMDPYFSNHIFDLFLDIFEDPEVTIREVRLLTQIKQLQPEKEGGKALLSREKAEIFKNELRRRGINFEFRLLDKNKLPHDRYFYSRGQSINMPPFSGAYGDHKHISEYTRSSTDISFFQEFWDQATEISKC